jgi:hypothetical protein
MYFGKSFASLKTYHLVPLLALSYKQYICRRLKLEKYGIHQLNFMSNLLISIYSDGGGVKFMKLFFERQATKVWEPLVQTRRPGFNAVREQGLVFPLPLQCPDSICVVLM